MPGSKIKRPFPTTGLKRFDPFLLLDHFGPSEVPPGPPKTLPEHPHCGFCPVTIMFEGTVKHRDSLGSESTVSGGGVQWITAGKGVTHEETMIPDPKRVSTHHGVQLWVNLPKAVKRIDPAYFELPAETIPEIEVGKARLRVISGEYGGLKGPAPEYSPVTIMNLIIEETDQVELNFPESYNVGVYILEGQLKYDERLKLDPTQFIEIENDGAGFVLDCPSNANLLVLAGEPLHEPVSTYGPFVGNHFSDIQQAVSEYERGLYGSIAEPLTLG